MAFPAFPRHGPPRMTIRLIAVDIDGTLLDSQGRLPDSHRDALIDAAAQGIEVALVTGRSFHFARPVADLLPIPLTMIVNNGAVVKDKSGGTLLRHVLSRHAAKRILDETRAFEDSVAIVFDRPSVDHERQIVFGRMDWSHPNRRGYFRKNRAFIAEATGPLDEELAQDDPIQVMFNGSVEPMRDLVAQLRALPIADQLTVALTEYVHRDFSLVDVNGPACSKGTTLAKWVASRSWTRDDVMAVGDNLNDIEMLDFAGLPFVMGNAAAEMKARGYPITGSNDDGGLAEAVRSALTAAAPQD